MTKVEDFKNTVAAFEKAFAKEGLDKDVWERVIGVVVQPGVEEKDSGCTEYDREKAKDLMAAIKDFPTLVFEGHSTDYQTKIKLRELVEDGVGILKVGPGLTFAMREAMFALENIEKELIYGTDTEPSKFAEVLDAEMLKNDKNWKKHLQGTELEIRLKEKIFFLRPLQILYADTGCRSCRRSSAYKLAYTRNSAEPAQPVHADPVYEST